MDDTRAKQKSATRRRMTAPKLEKQYQAVAKREPHRPLGPRLMLTADDVRQAKMMRERPAYREWLRRVEGAA